MVTRRDFLKSLGLAAAVTQFPHPVQAASIATQSQIQATPGFITFEGFAKDKYSATGESHLTGEMVDPYALPDFGQIGVIEDFTINKLNEFASIDSIFEDAIEFFTKKGFKVTSSNPNYGKILMEEEKGKVKARYTATVSLPDHVMPGKRSLDFRVTRTVTTYV